MRLRAGSIASDQSVRAGLALFFATPDARVLVYDAPSKSVTSDFSSFNSFTLTSILPRLNSLIGTFRTTSAFPALTRTGNEQIKPFSASYSPFEQSATLCQSFAGVSSINDRTVSITAFAAEAAEES